jgi:ABC-2 type transport system permease protein
MSALTKITTVEAKLYLRDPTATILVLGLPVGLLVVFGSIGLGEGDETVSPGFLPSMSLGLALAMLGLSILPTVLATYREKGVLRRMQATPVHPIKLLLAQLVVNLGAAVVSAVLVVVIGALFFDIAWPPEPLAFVVAFLLSAGALMSIGLLVAAWATTAKAATSAGLLLFFPSMFFAGVWTPGDLMPEWARPARDVTPLGAGMQALEDAWEGAWLEPIHLVSLVLVTVVASGVASRQFRWS